ncbi:MAG: response regulator [Gemmatimonas sp.]
MDDEPHIGLIVCTRLEQGPFAVLLARDGPEALELLAAHPRVALVILDLMLPGMSGTEVLAAIRADERWRNMPCLILTATGQDAQLLAAEALGVSGVMTKPFSPRRLYDRVVTLTSARPSSLRVP